MCMRERDWERDREKGRGERERKRALGSWFDEGCTENVNQTITLHLID